VELDTVPQEGNAAHAGHRKLVYALDRGGRVVGAASRGWEAEEIVTLHAVHAHEEQARQARERVRSGQASPLEYWMYTRRMDVALLAQTSGFWTWRVRRDLRPKAFARLSARRLARYAQALGLSVPELTKPP
jgi:hypothetical protein